MKSYSDPDYYGPDREPAGDPFQTDYRQATREILRVLVARRRFFLIPCCLGLTAAFCISHYIPRRFVAKTVFERRDDPVLATVFRPDLQASFDTIRKSITRDLKGEEAIRESILQLPWAKGLPRNDRGELTANSARKVQDLIRDVAANIRVKLIENSENLDVVEFAYAGEDPVRAAQIVNNLREHYIRRTRELIDRLMRDSHAFLDKKVLAVSEDLDALSRSIADLNAGLPAGIDIENNDAIRELTTKLTKSLDERKQRGIELAARIESGKKFLRTGGHADMTGAGNDTGDLEVAVLNDPEVIQVRQDLDAIKRRINDLRTTRRMRESHPDVSKYVREKERIEERLLNVKREAKQKIKVTGADALTGVSLNARTTDQTRRMMADLESLETLHARNQDEISRIERRLAEIENMAPVIRQRHLRYLDLTKREKDLNASIALWQKNLVSVNRWFEVRDSKKASVFRTLQPARPTTKPFSPRLGTVIVFCAFFGGLMGALGVFLAEIFDSRLRSAEQVRTLLGVPIIEQVSEIVTPLAHRKRYWKRMLLQPALALLLVCAVVLSGLSAYMRLERPGYSITLGNVPGQVPSSPDQALVMNG